MIRGKGLESGPIRRNTRLNPALIRRPVPGLFANL